MSRDYAFPKAVDWEDLSDKRKAQIDLSKYVIQPKLDGCAMVIRCVNGKVTAETGSGKPVLSMDHIVDRIIMAVALIEPGVGDFIICGEVWAPGLPFAEISGAFRRHSEQRHLQFHAWDYVCIPDDYASWKYRVLRQLHSHFPWIPVVRQTGVYGRGLEAAKYAASDLVELGCGYDGVILRDPTAPWFTGRSKGEVIKIKPLVSMDLEVIGVEDGCGKETGRITASLVCRISKSSGLTQKVSTGMTHAQQPDAVENPHNWIGKIVEVEGMGFTADDLIREPRFKGVRDDKLVADS